MAFEAHFFLSSSIFSHDEAFWKGRALNSLITTLIMVCEMVGVVVGPNVAMADMGWFLVPSSGFVYCLALALHSALLP